MVDATIVPVLYLPEPIGSRAKTLVARRHTYTCGENDQIQPSDAYSLTLDRTFIAWEATVQLAGLTTRSVSCYFRILFFFSYYSTYRNLTNKKDMINKGIVRQFLAAIAGKEVHEILCFTLVLWLGSTAIKLFPSCNDEGRIIFWLTMATIYQYTRTYVTC